MNRYISLSPSLFPLWLQQVEVATTKQEKKKREFRTAANVKKKKRRKKIESVILSDNTKR